MVYHFEAQIPACLHTSVQKEGRGGERESTQSKGTETQKGKKETGVQREDLSHEVEQQKQGKEMVKENHCFSSLLFLNT